MDAQNSILAMLKFVGKRRQDLVKIEYDFDEAHPKLFSETIHMQALVIGLLSIGIGGLIMLGM